MAALCGLALALAAAGTALADRQTSWTLDKDGQPLGAPLPYVYDFEIDGLYKPSGTFKNPADLFVDRDSNLWIADTGNNRVLEFDADGTFLREIGTAEGEGQLNGPEGIFIAERGDIWVADRGNGRIVRFAPDGTFVEALGKPRSKLLEEDQVYQPNKLVIDRRGYIYVLDANRNNVQIFRPTEFATLLHQASRLYYDGRYQEAADVWREVLRHDAYFELAHTGLAKALFKRGDYLAAMHEYEIARNATGYTPRPSASGATSSCARTLAGRCRWRSSPPGCSPRRSAGRCGGWRR